MTEWIPVYEKLPEVGVNVLVYTKFGNKIGMDKLEIFLREKCSELDTEELVNLSTLLLGGYIASLSNKTDKEKGLDVIVNQIKYHSQRIEGLE